MLASPVRRMEKNTHVHVCRRRRRPDTNDCKYYARPLFISVPIRSTVHYYRKVNLFWLGNLCCPGFPTENVRSGQKGCLFVPGLATGTKSPFFLFLFSQLFFYFDYTFTFQLNLCIGIQCVRSPLIYTYI